MRKTRKLSWLEAAALGVLGCLKLAAAPAQEVKPVENPLNSSTAQIYAMSQEKTEAQKAEGDEKWAFCLDNTVATDYVFGNGMVIGREPGKHRGVNQTFFGASKDNLSAFLWSDIDFNDKEIHEVDIGTDYTIPFGDSFSVTGGAYVWTYPSKFIGDHSDYVLHGAASYKGPVNLDVCIFHLLEYEDVDSGTCFNVKASKEFSLGKLAGFDVSATPSLEAGLTHRFYDETEGLKAVTPGVDLSFSKDSYGIRFFFRALDGKDGVDDINYGGVTFSIPLDSQ